MMRGGDGNDGGTASDPRFLLLLDTLPYPAFVISTGGRAVHYNAALVAYVGHLPGPDRAARTALLHPEDQTVLEAARAAAVPADAEYVVEVRLRRHDGAHRWHRVHNKPLFEDGRRVAYLGTAIDVQDARAAHQLLEDRVQERTQALEAANARLADERARYRELYNRTPMALHSSDASARLIEVNDTWLEMFGYGRSEVLGRSPSEFMTPESAALYHDRAWPEMLASGGAARVVDYSFVAAGGRLFDGRLAARGVFDPAGRLLRTWAAIADVTAEKRAEGTLRQAQRMEAIGQLTAGIAHDFNNLLTAILANLELAARPGGAEQRQRRLIDGARVAAERGARLTEQLLAFSRQQRLVPEPVAVGEVLERMRPLLASAAGSGIDLQLTVAPGLGPAFADAVQLELAVLNLVINARDALGGAGRVQVAARRVEVGAEPAPEEPPPGPYVAVEVQDDGPGIPPAVRERMFEPFFTTKPAGRGAGSGSGLGLAQVLGIANQVGGGVRVRTAPGQGTMIALLLPLSDQAPAPRVPPAPGPAMPVPPRSILLVDDDADVRAATCRMLEESGHRVTAVESGAAALEVLARALPLDLVLADVVMPGMDGGALAGRIAAQWPGLPVLLMTGYADSAALPPELWDRVLAKPFRAAELERCIAAASPPFAAAGGT